jgi:hypothetical protein
MIGLSGPRCALLVVGVLLVGCGGANSQDLGPTGSSSGDTGDGGPGSGDAASGDTGGVVDAKSDGAGSSSGGDKFDASGIITRQITITDFFQNCMPVVAADPIILKGTISIANGTSADIGPISFTSGSFLHPATLAVIASFKLKPVTMNVVQPGGNDTVGIEKQQNSASPANFCQTLTCGSEVVVEVIASGPGIPANDAIRTNPLKLTCAL